MSVLTTKLRRDLGRNKAQFIAIAITIFLGITLFGGSFDAYKSLEASYEQMYDDLEFADLWVTGGDVDGFAAAALATDGVVAAETRHQAEAGIKPVPDRALYGRLVGIPVDDQPAVNRLMILDGSYLSGPDSVLVDHHLANHYGILVGDVVEVADANGDWQALTVDGIVASAEYIWVAPSRQQLLATPDEFGVLFVADDVVVTLSGPGAVSHTLVTYATSADAPALTDTLTSVALELGASDVYDQLGQPSNSALQQDVKGFGDLAFMFPMLFLTAAGLGAWVMLTRLVMTQLPVIGTLMANGMKRGRLFRHYLSYGVFVGLSGAIPGVIVGSLMAWGIAGVYTSAVGVPVTVVKIEPTTILMGLSFGLVAGLISAALPAWRAIGLSPAEALRGSRPTGVAQATLLERMIPRLTTMSTERALVLRNVVRNRRRTLTTMLGVVLALVLILVSWGMIDTVQVLVDKQFQQVELSDARVVLAAPADSLMLGELQAVAGVESVESIATLPVVLEANGERYATGLQGFMAGTTMRGFVSDAGPITLPDDGVLLGIATQDLLGVDAGDTITLRVPALNTTILQSIAGFVAEPLGTPAYISIDQLGALAVGPASSISFEDLAGSGIEFGAAVRLDAGVEFDLVRPELEAVSGVVAVTSTRSLEQMFHSIMKFFNVFVGVMLAFGGLLAFGIIFNTMSVNLAERQVEVATMKAAGVTDRRIARLITAENLIVTLVAIVPGLVIGFLVAREFMAAYESDQFSFTLAIRWTTFVVSAGFILVVTLLSQRPGLREIRRLDIAKIVRERAV
jgi:putative ABC transport system permease protein